MASSPLSIFCLVLLLPITIRPVESSTEKAGAAFFIFGDSVVDPGNNNHIETVAELRANYAPYGSNGYFDKPTGRFNDGRVMVDFIAEYAKLPLIPPFKQPDARFTNGANFASGGAGVLPDTNPGLVIDLQTQLKQFEEVLNLLAMELGDANTKQLIANAVYFISIGSNDYIASYLFSPEKQNAYPPEEFIGMVIGNLTLSIQQLYEKGARKFCFLSLSPLGCLPAFRAANPNADGGCFEDVSKLAMAHNSALSAVLTSFAHILRGFKHTNANLYDWLYERIHHPTKYGFKDGMNACCGTGQYGGVYSCGGLKQVSEFRVCENPLDHVWWDSIHATERIHEQFAKVLWSEKPSSMGAYNLEELFFDHNAMIGDVVDDMDGMEKMAHMA